MKFIDTILLMLLTVAPAAALAQGPGRMDDTSMMGDWMTQGSMMGGPMMFVCMLFLLLIIVLLVLAVLSLIKYLRGGDR
ncbi:hypothetical protein SAMN04488490_1025 [Marinobacter sp. LV10R510-11A]|uniref:hypothetical protein n=1 Tax=Marinobacter sp. LV10R510-11A TaxID=1415568 RepID=UPI000BB70046|nr:hypothetical protein [Marinobacter sp. LV10R510-11A]SOB75432.1 hypothetical protein SAMN04488490_1025 [Marinobacter sp. LV10R510-11A]